MARSARLLNWHVSHFSLQIVQRIIGLTHRQRTNVANHVTSMANGFAPKQAHDSWPESENSKLWPCARCL